MSAPASEGLRELERVLLAAAELGEARDFNALREETALERDELLEGLEVLREHGKAVEQSPGEWRGPLQDELDAMAEPVPERVVVQTLTPPADELEDEPGNIQAPQAGEPMYWTSLQAPSRPTVRLTMRIAQALEPAALGALIKAGIDEASDAGATFVLEVVP